MNIEDTLEVTNAVDQVKPKRKGRGKGKKPAMVGTSVRVPEYVLSWFKLNHPHNLQSALREVLTKHVDTNTNC